MASNPTTPSPTGAWAQHHVCLGCDNENAGPCWYAGADDECRVTAAPPAADAPLEMADEERRNTRYKHVPHRDRPPLIVARRNARERRRVQAVNSAFTRLRKAVPIVSNRGKRVSKVKTLQTAIDYISSLQALLKQADMYHDLDIISNYRYHSEDFIHVLEEFENEF